MQRSTKTTAPADMTQSMDDIRKRAIVDALSSFIAEMKLVDVADLVAYIRTDKHGNISDLVQSAAELSFRQSTLRYAMSACVDVDWGKAPEISLSLEFFNAGVWVYFTLVLAEPENRIIVDYIELSQGKDEKAKIETPSLPPLEADVLTKRLLAALADAQIQPS